MIILNSLYNDAEDKLILFFSAKPAQTSRSHSDVSPNLDEFEEDNGEVSESSDFEPVLAVSTVISDRWIPQPRLCSGYLTYVIFTGPKAGVFYNWSV